MATTDEILERAARDGSIDIAEWPRVLESVLQRLRDIVQDTFPKPNIPLPAPLQNIHDPEVVASTPPPLPSESEPPATEDPTPDASSIEPPPNSQSSTKENDVPAMQPPTSQPMPGIESSIPPSDTQPTEVIDADAGTVPPELLSKFNHLARQLERDFAKSPPYTIQRLAELVLYPDEHYNYLPSWLRALDRVVSVSSPASDFPLPVLQASSSGGFLTNGEVTQINGAVDKDSLGSDESLGGALLTPIPWLRNQSHGLSQTTSQSSTDGELHSESTETIEGPNGPGGIETVSVTVNGVPSASSAAHTTSQPASPTLSEQSDASSSSSTGSTEAQLREQGAVTQGELLRQEQEAGVVPVAQATPRRAMMSSGAVAVGRGNNERASAVAPAADVVSEVEETPHARGPELIGMEDTGPQAASAVPGHLDLEAAVGRQKSPQPPNVTSPPPAPQADAAMEKTQSSNDGEPGQDPKDVEMRVERLKEAMDEDLKQEAKDADGDVVVADADGRPVEEGEKKEAAGDLGGADAANPSMLAK